MCLLSHIPGRILFLETTPLLLSLCAYQSTSQRKECIAVVVSPLGGHSRRRNCEHEREGLSYSKLILASMCRASMVAARPSGAACRRAQRSRRMLTMLSMPCPAPPALAGGTLGRALAVAAGVMMPAGGMTPAEAEAEGD